MSTSYLSQMMAWIRNRITSFAAIVVLLLSFTGCSSQNSLPPRLVYVGQPIVEVSVYISHEFNDDVRAGIIDGMLMWERATAGMVIWHVYSYSAESPPVFIEGSDIENRTVIFVRATSEDEWVKEWERKDEKRKYLLGMCQGNASLEVAVLWIIDDRLTSRTPRAVIAAHELGHALGLEHLEKRGSVMSEYPNTSLTSLTVDDLKFFCDKYKCDPGLLHAK